MAFQSAFGLFLWSTGCLCQTIDSLHHCCLCISFDSILTLIKNIADNAIKNACRCAHGPHCCCYDNINLSTSIFVEQRDQGPAKVQSGMFAVLYELRNIDPIHMKLKPIVERAKRAKDLEFNNDVRPTKEQLYSHNSQLLVHVIRVLTTFSEPFSSYAKLPEFQHTIRRKIPVGHKTVQYPLQVSTIDESSVTGNIAVLKDIYVNQLGMDPNELKDLAIPSINDQSTNACIRGAKALRAHDMIPFSCIENFQLGFGLFHLCLNLTWAILHVHRSSVAQIGSLTYFFGFMQKARLGAQHPDYHTLLAALMQVLYGIILNAWKRECGFLSPNAFATSNPNLSAILEIAQRIITDYATALPTLEPPDDEEGSDSSQDKADDNHEHPAPKASASEVPKPHPKDDFTHRNLRLLTRDLLIITEVVHAVSEGDFGRVEDMLDILAMVFRGARSNNYCSEILHFIFGLKRSWPPGFAYVLFFLIREILIRSYSDIMHDNMLVNVSGCEGHSMGVDLNIEHLIGFLKVSPLFSRPACVLTL
jgi:hypothetical protein